MLLIFKKNNLATRHNEQQQFPCEKILDLCPLQRLLLTSFWLHFIASLFECSLLFGYGRLFFFVYFSDNRTIDERKRERERLKRP